MPFEIVRAIADNHLYVVERLRDRTMVRAWHVGGPPLDDAELLELYDADNAGEISVVSTDHESV